MNMRITIGNRSFRPSTLLLLFCFLFSLQIHAESLQTDKLTVTGVVTDSRGETIIGASIAEVGTTNGTITGIDGDFSIQVAPNATLRFSYIGYKDQEHVISRSTTLKIVLEENSEMIDEVVVVGYGTQKKANLTGSVSAVNFKDVASMPVANTANMLQGRLPGVTLTNNGAQAGKDNPEIRIRGVGTLSDNNDPMVLIDGVESSVSQISEIPADDIENVSVLKDAASASIYGVRAANGVILVTTKRGTDQKPQITYAGNVAVQQATVLPDFVHSADWAQMYNEAHGNNFYTDEMIRKLRDGSDPDHFANTDWADAMFRTAVMHQHHLSVNGGSKNVHYMMSTQYFHQDGILKNTANQRFNFRSNLDAQLGIVKLGLNLSGSKQSIDEPITSVTGDGLMRFLTWYTRPTVPVQYSNGHWGCVDGTSLSQSIFKNPLDAMSQGHKDNEHYRFDGKFFGEIDLMKGLKFRSSLAYKYYMNDVSTFSPKNALKYDAEGNALTTPGNNTLTDYHYLQTTYINENILTYDVALGNHNLSLMAGHSIQASRTDVNESSKQGFPTDNLWEMNAGTSNDKVTGYANENSLQSFFGRINYNFADRYLLEMNIRHDGSSRLPKSDRYATFPSFSGAWIITNEKFMEDVKYLTSLKVRASWGMLGNQEIGDYAYTSLLSADANYYFGSDKQIGLRSKAIANDKIKWETTTITDFGLDASFWQGRITATFDWFDKETSDILLKLPMPTSYLGTLDAPYQNAGKVRNRGWELSANYFDRKGDFSWQAGFSLSAVRNKIIDMKGVENISNNTINREGHPIGSYYGLKAIGIYRTEADLNRTTIVNGEEKVITQFGSTPSLGDIMYEDLTGDGNITDDDRDIIGNPFPKMQYAFNLGFSWKNFDISMFWQGVGGVYRYNWDETIISNGGNKTSRWLDRYSADNVNGSMPRLGNLYNDKYSSFWLSKADYLRLKNLELGYTFKQQQLVRFGIQSIRLYLAGTNLLTFSSLDDYDPEKTGTDSRNDVHPNARTYSFGVNVKF
ncbi:SusC/RagA family TonB-linked outer membrane protein [Parabacteroides sp.]